MTTSPSRNPRIFYAAMGCAITVLVFFGFARSYFLKAWFDFPPLSTTLHFHGLLLTMWLLLFVLQTYLIISRRRPQHMMLGRWTAGLAVVCVATTIAAAIESAKSGESEAIIAVTRLYSSILLVTMFGLFVGAGVLYRRRADVHKRFMLLAMMTLVGPGANRAVALILGHTFRDFHILVIGVLLVAALLYDWRTRGRPHPTMFWGGLLLIFVEVTRGQVGRSDAWGHAASWILG